MEDNEIIKEITETKALAESNKTNIAEMKDKIEKMEKEQKAIHEIATSVKLIAQDMKNIRDNVTDLKTSQSQMRDEMNDIKNSSIERKAAWMDKIVGAIVGAVGAGVLAYLLTQIAPTIFK